MGSDGKTNAGARDGDAFRGELNNAGDLRGGEARLTINRHAQRIANDRLTDLTGYASKCRNRIRKRRGRILNGKLHGSITGNGHRVYRHRRRSRVSETDPVDENIVRRNARRRPITLFTRQGDVFVFVVADDERNGKIGAVAGHADPADENSIFVKRQTAGRTIQRRTGNGKPHHAGRSSANRRRRHSEKLFEPIDIGKRQVGKPHADEWPRRRVFYAIREMLLDDEAGRARSERVLIAAQECGRARFGNRVGNFGGGRFATANGPDAENKAFAIDYSNDTVWRNLKRARHGAVDDRLHVNGGELLSERRRGQRKRRRQNGADSQSFMILLVWHKSTCACRSWSSGWRFNRRFIKRRLKTAAFGSALLALNTRHFPASSPSHALVNSGCRLRDFASRDFGRALVMSRRRARSNGRYRAELTDGGVSSDFSLRAT